MATITPTMTIAANSASSTSPGPLSVALNLTAGGAAVNVDNASSSIVNVDNGSGVLLTNGGTAGLAGTDGGYIYIANITASGSDMIYIGVEATGATSDLAGGTAADGSGDPKRLGTLKRGEFMFFPFDYTMDITVDASANNQKLEYWIFDRA